MPQVFLTNGAKIEMNRFDPAGQGAVLSATATTFSYLTRSNDVVTLNGSGFAYATNQLLGPQVGTVSSLQIVGSGANAAQTFQIADLSLDAGAFGSDVFTSEVTFWRTFFSTTDSFDLAQGQTTTSLVTPATTFAADGVSWTNSAVSPAGAGSSDVIALGSAAGAFHGDLLEAGATSAPQTAYTGGNDTVTGTAGAQSQIIVGDVGNVRWIAQIVGGADTISIASPGTIYGDVYRQLFGGTLTAGDDTMILSGSGFFNVFGDIFEGDDFGGLFTFHGGDDEIDGSAALGGARIIGDIGSMILNRTGGTSDLTLGDDHVTGTQGADTIVGDIGFVSAISPITLGSDTIDGGAGNDIIFGDYETLGVNFNQALFRSGFGADVLNGGAGSDTIHGQLGNDLLDGGAGDDTMLGGLGDDTYFVDSVSDLVVEQANEGFDVARARVGGYVLAANVEQGVMLSSAGGLGNGSSGILSGNSISNLLSGNDQANFINVGGGSNLAYGAGGDDQLLGGGLADLLSGQEGDDALIGGGGSDILLGNAGNDILDGAAGIDALYGDVGNDTFRIGSVAFGEQDTIFDFGAEGGAAGSTGRLHDVIGLQAFNYGALGADVEANEFVVGTSGQSATQDFAQIIFETDTGRLLYDSDGTGSGQAFHIATVQFFAGTIQAEDFDLV